VALIELKNISRVYQMGDTALTVLNGLDLSIDEGEFVAIIGPSGSGKSTLMQILGLLDRPTSGTYTLLGKDVSGLSDDEAARMRSKTIGFIFQMFNLLARTSAFDNVMLPMIYSSAPDRADHAKKILEKMGLGDRLDHKPNQLSGGQQQRVAISRALVNNPKIIFADEPTGNLASTQAAEILKMLEDMNKSGITVILVTHDLEIAGHARRIIHIKDGKIVKDERRQPVIPAKAGIQAGSPIKTFGDDVIEKENLIGELREQCASALRALTSNKVRSLLSVLGILIGVAAVIAMLAMGRGAQKAIETRIASLGSNLLMLRPEAPSQSGVRTAEGFSRLKIDDIDALRVIPNMSRIDGNVTGAAQIVYGNENRNVRVEGAMPTYAKMRNSEPYFGRFFTDAENIKMDRVVLLGQTTVSNLFKNEDPVGKLVKINRINFEVIGVLPAKGSSGWRDQDDVILLPLNTAMRRVLGKKYLDNIYIECDSAETIPVVTEEVTEIMRKRHRLPEYKDDDFSIRNMADIQATLTGTTKTFTTLLAVVATISLLVGGIGIMNIMLVSVSERTREIGLRKAVGATRRAILSQFLIEAVVLAMTGGGTGILLGLLISLTLSKLAGWASIVTLDSIVVAATFSAVVGVVFGFWPAKKASLLSPIEALRYE
jgi:macrolide transport system ATP-binding/permease protein